MIYSQPTKIRAFGFILLSASCIASTVLGGDTGWLQPGIRLWYVGGVSTVPTSVDAETAIVIDRFENGAAYMTQHSAVRYWSSPMPAATVISPQAASEGAFWINPARLAPLQAGTVFTWKSQLYVVSRATYTLATLPFLHLLPETALFNLSPAREIITLSYAKDDITADYFFDVQMGLLLSQTERLTSGGDVTITMLTLSEINYDFATRTAFAEDTGLHTAFGGYYSASRNKGFAQGTQGYQLTPAILSRYKNRVLFRHTGCFMDTNWLYPVAFDQYVAYDADLQLAYLSDDGTNWTANGDHIYMWMPPADRSSNHIRVWNIDLDSSAPGIFAASGSPTVPGFNRLAFDASGYVNDLDVVCQQLNFWVDSSLDPNRTNRMDGPSYYQNTIIPAQPTSGSIVAFVSSAYSVNETEGSVTIAVTRNGGNSSGCSVNYATCNGTAQAGTDYTSSSGTLSWSAGDAAAKTITISIANRGANNSKTFKVTLSDTLGGALGCASETTVTIQRSGPDIKINGEDGPLNIAAGQAAVITLSMEPGALAGYPVDWWVLAQTAGGWYYLNASMQWTPLTDFGHMQPVIQCGLFRLASYTLLDMTTLPAGAYTFYFAVDQQNGRLDMDAFVWYDAVSFNIQ